MFSNLFKAQNFSSVSITCKWINTMTNQAICACSLETSAHSTDLDSSIDVLLNMNMHFEVINPPFLKNQYPKVLKDFHCHFHTVHKRALYVCDSRGTVLTAALVSSVILEPLSLLLPTKTTLEKTVKKPKCILLTGHIPYIPPFPDQHLWFSLW